MSARDWLSLYLGEARDKMAEGRSALYLAPAAGRDTLLRVAHTLKGMSATMGYRGLADAFHEIEELAQHTDRWSEIIRRWDDLAALLDRAQGVGHDRELRAHGLVESAPVAEASPWIEISPRDDEPMPRARLFQWLRELQAWGVTEIIPDAETLRRPDAPLSLRLRAGSAILARVQELPKLSEIRLLAETDRPPASDAPRGRTLLRVDLPELDALFAELGELHTELRVLRSALPGGREWERGIRTAQGLVARALHRASGVRLSTLEPLMDVFEAAAHEAARRLDRRVHIEREGGRMRIAREIIERLHPLLPHVARNCVAHGIEPADERIAAGKPAEGTLRILAEQRGATVRLRIEDDGRGVDPAYLRKLATEAGLKAAQLDSRQLHQLLFRSGSSSRSAVDAVSGRGVGLAAVREAVRAARGNIRADSTPGRGFQLEIELPLPLSLMPLLEVRVGKAVIGMIDAGWSAVPPTEEPNHRLPDLPEDGALHLVRDGARLAVDGVRSLGNVWVHPVRPPISRMEGVIGFHLDGEGRPRLVMEPLPRSLAQLPLLRFWGRGLQALRSVLGGLDSAGATAWLPDPERALRAWVVEWPGRRRVVLALVDPGPETARRLFGLSPEDPADAMDEQANWVITRALESDGVPHDDLMLGGPPMAVERIPPVPPGARVDACALAGDDGRARLVLWREEWAT